MPRGRKKQEPVMENEHEPVMENEQEQEPVMENEQEPVMEEKKPKKRGRKPKSKTVEKKTEKVINDDKSDNDDTTHADISDNDGNIHADSNLEVTDDNSSNWDGMLDDNSTPVKSNTQSYIERGSAHISTNRTNTRVKVIEMVDDKSDTTYNKGKTYNRKDFERKNTVRNTNRKTNVSQSVLRFSYEDAINVGRTKTLSEASRDEILRYLIATTTEQRALCNVLRNTLSGIHNETTLPQTTYGPRHNTKSYRRRE